MYLPTIIETTGRGERVYDIYSRLLKERIIFIGTGIDDQVANAVIAQMIFLEYEDPEKDIIFYINSPGGLVSAGLAIYDTMVHVKPDVSTICVGSAASTGLLGSPADSCSSMARCRISVACFSLNSSRLMPAL